LKKTLLLCLCWASAALADARLDRLDAFLEGRPAHAFAAEFLAAADKYDLDWRLLPALCVIETSGGKHVRARNNWFGWRSGHARFRSIHQAIETVAYNLGCGDRYRGKSTTAKLRAYNRRRGYPAKVRRTMLRIGKPSY
jgi:hypothetical protein